MRHLPALGLLLGAYSLFVQAQTIDESARVQAAPGTLNYIEGAASLEGKPLLRSSAGAAIASAGQQFATSRGKVEVALAQGVFLRLDEESTVRMVALDPAHIEVAVERGTAEIEVEQAHHQGDVLVGQNSSQTRLEKPGVYEFRADPATVRVLDGKAGVLLGSGRNVTLKQGHVLDLSAQAHPSKFDRDEFSDPLTDWGNLRSAYLNGEVQDASTAYADRGMVSYGSGTGSAGAGTGSGWVGDDSGTGSYVGSGFLDSSFGSGLYSPFAFGGFGSPYGLGFYGGYPYGAGFGPGFGLLGGGFYGGGLGFYGGGLGGYGGLRGFAPPIRGGGYSSGFNNTGTGRPIVGPIHPGGLRPAPTAGYHPVPAGGYHPAPAGSLHAAPAGGFHGSVSGGAAHAGGGHR